VFTGTSAMDSIWFSEVLPLLPWLAGTLVFVEIAAYFASRGLLRLQVFTSVSVLALLVLLEYAIQPRSYAMQMRPIAYFLVYAWTMAVPLAVLSAGAYLLSKTDAAVWRHIGLLALSVAVIAVLPIFALWSICASGVDCI